MSAPNVICPECGVTVNEVPFGPCATHGALSDVALRNKLLFIRDGGHTTRFHSEPRIEPEKVGQHSFGVIWLLWLLSGGTASAALLMHGARHDLAEHVTGDIPAPTKHELGIGGLVEDYENLLLEAQGLALPPLTPDEEDLLWLADRFDGMLSCCREMAMGNKFAAKCFHNWRTYLDGQPQRWQHRPIAVALYATIFDLWEESVQ
jgi:5'-deoxynucleotidase YfbR-like HD superfamily hydrolase